MNTLLSILFTLLNIFLKPSLAYGPYQVQKFHYYVSQSPSRVSYSGFTFYDPTSGITTSCTYKAGRGGGNGGYVIPGPLPTDYIPCKNKAVSWKYEAEGQQIHVDFGYLQPNSYTGGGDWIRIWANGTVIPTGCTPYGKYGYMCDPKETRYLQLFAVVI